MLLRILDVSSLMGSAVNVDIGGSEEWIGIFRGTPIL